MGTQKHGRFARSRAYFKSVDAERTPTMSVVDDRRAANPTASHTALEAEGTETEYDPLVAWSDGSRARTGGNTTLVGPFRLGHAVGWRFEQPKQTVRRTRDTRIRSALV